MSEYETATDWYTKVRGPNTEVNKNRAADGLEHVPATDDGFIELYAVTPSKDSADALTDMFRRVLGGEDGVEISTVEAEVDLLNGAYAGDIRYHASGLTFYAAGEHLREVSP